MKVGVILSVAQPQENECFDTEYVSCKNVNLSANTALHSSCI